SPRCQGNSRHSQRTCLGAWTLLPHFTGDPPSLIRPRSSSRPPWRWVGNRPSTRWPNASGRTSRAEVRADAADDLKGRLQPVARKNRWPLAEATGHPTPYAVQHLLGRAPWDADAVRDDLRRDVEDSSNGIRSAHAAGMRVVAIPNFR